jgi:hypothetical protein
MARSFGGIVFLATPHRITSFPEELKPPSRIGQRKFIEDMVQLARSNVVEDINNRFQHASSNLPLWSFFETRVAEMPTHPILFIDKDSSLLGYPGEIAVPLDANHADVCKFGSPKDINYLKVLEGLKMVIKNTFESPLGLYTPLSFQKVEV